jgi:restriction endonuclease S subunit
MNTFDLVGECGYVPCDFPNLFIPDRLWLATVRRDINANAKWLSFLLCAPEVKRRLGAAATGTSGTMKNLSKTAFLGLEVGIPDPHEQSSIAVVLSDMDGELAALEARRDKTRALKQGMMQELLTGRTRLV